MTLENARQLSRYSGVPGVTLQAFNAITTGDASCRACSFMRLPTPSIPMLLKALSKSETESESLLFGIGDVSSFCSGCCFSVGVAVGDTVRAFRQAFFAANRRNVVQ